MTWRDDPADDANDGKVGYGQPPKATRFKKGESGNRAGRPKGRHSQAPYGAIFGQMVRICEHGIERLVTAAEAFLFYLKKEAVKDGGGPAARGSVTSELETLRMAKKLDPYRETARMVLEPWLVEDALARLDCRLTPNEQRTVVEATRTPHKVRWPEWWSERPQ